MTSKAKRRLRGRRGIIVAHEVELQRAGGSPKGKNCHWCGRIMKGTQDKSNLAGTRDHVLAKSRGGTYTVWCCVACNGLKGDLTIHEWRRFMATNPRWWTKF